MTAGTYSNTNVYAQALTANAIMKAQADRAAQQYKADLQTPSLYDVAARYNLNPADIRRAQELIANGIWTVQQAMDALIIGSGGVKAGKAGILAQPFPKAPPAPPPPTPAELRATKCNRMGEYRCSVPCYSARRHVEAEAKPKRDWKHATDVATKMPFWMTQVPGIPVLVASTVIGIPSIGKGKIEHQNAHLRPRWR